MKNESRCIYCGDPTSSAVCWLCLIDAQNATDTDFCREMARMEFAEDSDDHMA